MRLSRFHIAVELVVGGVLDLPPGVAQHAIRVLRLAPGDALVLFNGDGRDYAARVTAIGRQSASVRIESAAPNRCETRLPITLVQALARGERMDLILQKATELGVSAILPVASERSEVKLDAERAARRIAHWRQVIVSACEQCGASRLPELAQPQALAQALAALAPAAAGESRLCLHPDAELRLSDIVDPSALCIAVGPEGGFSERDLALLDVAGFRRLALGPRILRTETAGPAMIAALHARFGDFV